MTGGSNKEPPKEAASRPTKRNTYVDKGGTGNGERGMESRSEDTSSRSGKRNERKKSTYFKRKERQQGNFNGSLETGNQEVRSRNMSLCT